jgi:hypothetical protein
MVLEKSMLNSVNSCGWIGNFDDELGIALIAQVERDGFRGIMNPKTLNCLPARTSRPR